MTWETWSSCWLFAIYGDVFGFWLGIFVKDTVPTGCWGVTQMGRWGGGEGERGVVWPLCPVQAAAKGCWHVSSLRRWTLWEKKRLNIQDLKPSVPTILRSVILKKNAVRHSISFEIFQAMRSSVNMIHSDTIFKWYNMTDKTTLMQYAIQWRNAPLHQLKCSQVIQWDKLWWTWHDTLWDTIYVTNITMQCKEVWLQGV